MKKLVILFILSILGIVLTQILGVFIFDIVGEKFHTIIAVIALLIKLLLFGVTVYTLVQSRKFRSVGAKIFKVLNWLVTLILAFVFTIYGCVLVSSAIEVNKYYNNKPLKELPKSAVVANVYQLIDYNGLPKEFILGIRKSNIGVNFLKLADYEPREEVWGKMVDNGNWLALNRTVCFDKETDCSRKLKGFSSLSRLINNPMILVAPVMIATYHLKENNPICRDKGLKLIPQKIYLDSTHKKITVVYAGTTVLTKCKYLQLSGLNARDFGLDWAKVLKTQNIKFPYDNNISQKAYQFKDEIISGKYCENSDAQCNVFSPIDDKVVFNITSYPANIELGLWKKQPFGVFAIPDFRMEIRFVE